MKHSSVMICVSLTAYVLTASAQLPAGTWNNPYSFYSNFNTPLAMAPQIISANEMVGNQKVFSSHDNHSIANTLGSHVVMLSTCLKELKTTKADLAHTAQRLDQTHTFVETVKTKLDNVMATVENMKKEMNASAAVSAASSAATSIGRMPKSCEDLRKIGHRKSGLFSVMGNKTVDNVYCDFTKPINDADFQKMIGYVDVKSSPVYFHAQRTKPHGNVGTTLPFDLLRVNVGNAMSTSGIFTAPKSGKYYFAFSSLTEERSSGRVELQIKTKTADWTRVTQAYGSSGYQTLSLQSTIELTKGDQIRLLFDEGSLFDTIYVFTNFVGHLLEEDIIQ